METVIWFQTLAYIMQINAFSILTPSSPSSLSLSYQKVSNNLKIKLSHLCPAAAIFSISTLMNILPSYAIDPSQLAFISQDQTVLTSSGKKSLVEELEKYQKIQAVLDTAEVEFIELPSGVSYREYRAGKGSRSVKSGAEVTVEMTIRCKSFATANDPGGVKYYSTQQDVPERSLTWTIGDGRLPPGLEEGMAGMRRGSIRRIELPSVQVFAARDAGQLPLPSKTNADGQRRFSNLFKTKADLLFEVLIDKIVQADES